MRIFFICRRVPFPPDRGDKIATCNAVHHLGRRHEVHVFCLGDGRADLDNIAGLGDCAASVTAAPAGRGQIVRRALTALVRGGGSLSVAALDQPELHKAIRRRFVETPPDLFIVYSSNLAQFAEPFAQVPRIIAFGDLDSLKWREFARHSPPPLRWLYALEARRLLVWERHVAASFSYSLVHTEGERRDFARLIPGAPVAIVGNGVDLDYFRSGGRPKSPASLIFTGVMNYRPNVYAVRWFCDEVLPRIRAEEPRVQLTICGSRPTRAVRRLASRPGVTVTGRVPDTRPYLDAAEVFVAPLRIARGVQNKLLEAMAMGLPCVASSTAWAGTVVAQGEGILAADGAAEFARRVLHLLGDGAARADLAAKARAAAEANYRWEVQFARLDTIIEALAPARSP